MIQRNWNRNVIFLTVIMHIKRISAFDNIMPAYAKYSPCEHVTERGYLTAKCGKDITNEDKDQSNYLPNDLQANIQALEIIPADTTEYLCFDFNYEFDFRRLTHLKRIIIRRVRPTEYRKNEWYTSWADCFKDITSLQHLEFTHSNLSENYTIGLPAQLKVLNLDDNKFEKLDIKECKALKELSANYNQLQNIPTFHQRNVPLKTLRLKGNPLDDMTILDLAPLCELTVLELEFPSGSHYSQRNSIVSYCDCVMLKKWSEEAGISGPEKVTCRSPKQDIECSNTIFEKAKRLHRGCPILKSHHSLPILKILENVLFVIMGLMLVAVTVLYIIRHFHLREKLARYHGPLSGASSHWEAQDRTSEYY